MNMKSTRPIWLSPSSAGRLPGANSQPCHAGASAPKTSGPNASPAIISPITGGCPIQRSSQASPRAVSRITTNCTSSRAWPTGQPVTLLMTMGAARERR
jgi:hypothetical protein